MVGLLAFSILKHGRAKSECYVHSLMSDVKGTFFFFNEK